MDETPCVHLYEDAFRDWAAMQPEWRSGLLAAHLADGLLDEIAVVGCHQCGGGGGAACKLEHLVDHVGQPVELLTDRARRLRAICWWSIFSAQQFCSDAGYVQRVLEIVD